MLSSSLPTSQRPALMFNGYQDAVASMYATMDLKKNFENRAARERPTTNSS